MFKSKQKALATASAFCFGEGYRLWSFAMFALGIGRVKICFKVNAPICFASGGTFHLILFFQSLKVRLVTKVVDAHKDCNGLGNLYVFDDLGKLF